MLWPYWFGAPGCVGGPPPVACRPGDTATLGHLTALPIEVPEEPPVVRQLFGEIDLERLECVLVDKVALLARCGWAGYDHPVSVKPFNPDALSAFDEQPGC